MFSLPSPVAFLCKDIHLEASAGDYYQRSLLLRSASRGSFQQHCPFGSTSSRGPLLDPPQSRDPDSPSGSISFGLLRNSPSLKVRLFCRATFDLRTVRAALSVRYWAKAAVHCRKFTLTKPLHMTSSHHTTSKAFRCVAFQTIDCSGVHSAQSSICCGTRPSCSDRSQP